MRAALSLAALATVACTSLEARTPASDPGQEGDASADATVVESDASLEQTDAKARLPHCIEYEGEEYCAPFVFEGASEAISIAGFAELKAVETLLPATLKPVVVSGQSVPRALVSLSAIHYVDTKLGPYREFVVQLLAQERGVTEIYYQSLPAYFAGISSGDPAVKHGFFVLRLTLDGEAAAAATDLGREFGRFPKFLGRVEMGASSWPSTSFQVEQPGGETSAFSVEASLWGTTLFPIWVNTSSSFDISTTGTEQPCWMQTRSSGRVASELFDLNDSFRAEGWLGDMLDDIAFVPAGWAISELEGSLKLDALSPDCWNPSE